MKNNTRVELLAPAGDKEAFYGAICAGADAVYLAGNKFGARAYAENFTEADLVECIRYSHLFGRKIYLTVNTLMKESDIEALYEFLNPLYNAGLDAVIVQDLGVIHFVREHFPNLEIHASTQISLCTEYGAELMQDMGVKRIVPARELSLEEIKQITKNTDIELETFIHGAMCYCYSGQCLFSSILGGRSGNRGRCAQPCRLPYTVTENICASSMGKKGIGSPKGKGNAFQSGKVDASYGASGEKYYLSMKDMCTIEHIPELINAGIHSFKMEGRMKKPEYAAGVTSIYRKYIDLYYSLENKYGAEEAEIKYSVSPEDLHKLKSLYIRSETQNGYYYRHNGKEMITLSNPGYSGSEDILLEEIRKQYLSKKLKKTVNIYAAFLLDTPVSLKMTCDGTTVTVFGNNVQSAQNHPISEDNIKKQITKLGDGPFKAGNIIIESDENIFYPLREINELRRKAVGELENILLKETYEPCQKVTDLSDRLNDKENMKKTALKNKYEIVNSKRTDIVNKKYTAPNSTSWIISVSTREQLQGLSSWYQSHPSAERPKYIYIPSDMALDGLELIRLVKSSFRDSHFLLSLPYVFRQADKDTFDKLITLIEDEKFFQGFLVRSADELGYLTKKNVSCTLHTDAGFYAWNSEAIKELSKWYDLICIPYELNASEQRELTEAMASFVKICYGRIPMMVSANCLLRTSGHCDKSYNHKLYLKDRYGKHFPISRDCVHCTNIIYNSVPLFLKSEILKWKTKVNLRLDFTVESCYEMNQILDSFIAGKDFKPSEYTSGHEKRGVE